MGEPRVRIQVIDVFEENDGGNFRKPRSKWDQNPFSGAGRKKNRDFQCIVCQGYVAADDLLAGVQNRNHCPHCLWSKHVDWQQAGDRMAVCKRAMRPLALTVKRSNQKYRPAGSGELMLVHQCEGCGKVSINRIAADDHPQRILALFEDSLRLERAILRQLERQAISCLLEPDRWLVERQLFGATGQPLPGDYQPVKVT